MQDLREGENDMNIRFYIRCTIAIAICLGACTLASCIMKVGYLIICSVIAVILSLLVLHYLRDVQKGESRKVIRTLKRMQYIEQDKQLTREELFRSYTADEFERR